MVYGYAEHERCEGSPWTTRCTRNIFVVVTVAYFPRSHFQSQSSQLSRPWYPHSSRPFGPVRSPQTTKGAGKRRVNFSALRYVVFLFSSNTVRPFLHFLTSSKKWLTEWSGLWPETNQIFCAVSISTKPMRNHFSHFLQRAIMDVEVPEKRNATAIIDGCAKTTFVREVHEKCIGKWVFSQ